MEVAVMNLREALYIMGLGRKATMKDLKARRAELALVHHPDVGGEPADFARIKEAYEVCKQHLPDSEPCKVCGGGGSIRRVDGFHVYRVTCLFCRGKGK
jgi:DnaJ-class molecular chaperone